MSFNSRWRRRGLNHAAAAHPGHHFIAQNEIGNEPEGLLEALFSIKGSLNAIFFSQHFRLEGVHIRIVVRHHDQRGIRRHLVLLRLEGGKSWTDFLDRQAVQFIVQAITRFFHVNPCRGRPGKMYLE